MFTIQTFNSAIALKIVAKVGFSGEKCLPDRKRPFTNLHFLCVLFALKGRVANMTELHDCILLCNRFQ